MNSIEALAREQAEIDLQLFLEVLPHSIRTAIEKMEREKELIEVVLDLGRVPTARFLKEEVSLRQDGVTIEEIEHVIVNLSAFDDDNRAGIARTLHRISCLRNRRGKEIGLTCRIGRAVYGTMEILRDIVEAGNSILILGAPGVGKTTMLREMARILAEEKRVIVVDTSNEIGGDGDIPHPAVGKARRMQVPRPAYQHETMIEAVENHNPQVIIIDEIGREQEAAAARTINERGVQLIGTAHGRSLENLLLNPTLSDLVGGIENVTLSDEEARRRGTQKTVLERRSPPTFNVLVEIQERQKVLVHRDVASSVDALLRGRSTSVELRWRDEEGKIQLEAMELQSSEPSVTGRRQDLSLEGELHVPSRSGRGGRRDYSQGNNRANHGNGNGQVADNRPNLPITSHSVLSAPSAEPPTKRLRIYSYGVARNRLELASTRLGLAVDAVSSLEEADMMVTLKSYYRKHRRLMMEAESQRKPVYVLRANSIGQIEQFLAELMGVELPPSDPFEAAIAEAQTAIDEIKGGMVQVDLAPAGTALRRYQHQLARQANLVSHSYGNGANRHVRIFSSVRNGLEGEMAEEEI